MKTSHLILLLSFSVAGADLLDDVLASAIFPASSPKCVGADASATSFSTTFASTDFISDWDVENAAYEQAAFEIDMIHSDSNSDRSWTLRLGKGGQINSFRVAAGEAIANQANPKAAWNDLVQQMVAVNGALNSGAEPNFIHQAGPYMKDTGMPPPFYSPNVALDCSGNHCATINWGQQAHVPTRHDSSLLYYTRYRDCGNGVIEYDMAMHHFGDSADMYNFFNTPWTGVRTSTFRDMMVASPSGDLEHTFPIGSFGPSVRNLETTGGFTTFAEDLELSPASSDNFEFGFCVDTTKVNTEASPQVANVPCDSSNPAIVPFSFVVQEEGTVRNSDYHAGVYSVERVVTIPLCDLMAPIPLGSAGWGNPYDGVVLVNDRTGFTFESDYIIHHCWTDGRAYMGSSVSADVLNQELKIGDTLTVKFNPRGKPFNDQTALTFVHGTNPEWGSVDFYRAKSRIRYGTTNYRRDGTVWTTNLLGKLYATETYFSRKYMITDSLSNMETVAKPLSDEAFEDVVEIDEFEGTGEVIKLWMDQNSFGASIGSEPCSTNADNVCIGSSTPKDGSKPWFYVTCGANKATTSNPYQFAVFEGSIKKPYLCVGEAETVRAEWKLLGYFTNCEAIATRKYQSDFCLASSSPTATSSEVPTSAPSARASETPSTAPSQTPTAASSESPTAVPSAAPSALPTVAPSTSPSESPSSTPTEERSAAPTESLSSAPSQSPSSSPSETSSSIPSANPTDDEVDLDDQWKTCDDRDGTFLHNSVDRNCHWLSFRSQNRINNLCKDVTVSSLCQETCGKCTDNCENDNDAMFEINSRIGEKNCKWVDASQARKDLYCSPDHDAYYFCRETCESCDKMFDTFPSAAPSKTLPDPLDDGICEDDDLRAFLFGADEKNCGWLRRQGANRQQSLCGIGSGAYWACEATCKRCIRLPMEGTCNEDGVCGVDENCESCPQDCRVRHHVTNGYCCVGGVCGHRGCNRFAGGQQWNCDAP